jgi:hypothetical protein
MHEDVVGTIIYLNEAKAFLTIEKLDDSFAGTDDLRGHWWATWATARGTKASSTATTAKSAAA